MDNLFVICQYCGSTFCNENKPKIMPCSHNICEKCIEINKKFLPCFSCKKKYTRGKIKKFPFNFALLEISSNEKIPSPSSFQSNNTLYCEKCNLNFWNDYHFKQSSHEIIYKDNNSVNDYQKEAEKLVEKYNNYNEKYEKLKEKSGKILCKLFKQFSKEVNFDQVDQFTLLLCCGLINPFDKKKLTLFYEDIYTNDKLMEIINKASSFEELSKEFNNYSLQNKSNTLTYNTFLHHLFSVADIQNIKLKNIDNNLNILSNKLYDNKNISEKLLQYLTSYIDVNLWSTFEGCYYKRGNIIHNNQLFVFEPIDQTLSIFDLPKEGETEIIAHYLNQDMKLYFLTTNGLFQYDINTLFCRKLPNSFYQHEKNVSLFVNSESLFLISPVSFEVLDLFDEVQDSKWEILSTYDEEANLEKIKIRFDNFNRNLLITKEISQYFGDVYLFSLSNYEWKKKNFSSDNCLSGLNIEKAAFFFVGKCYLFGAYNEQEEKYDEKIYEIELNKKIIKFAGNVPLVNPKRKIFYIDAAYTKEDYYLLVYYQLNDSKALECEKYLKHTKKGKYEYIGKNEII